MAFKVQLMPQPIGHDRRPEFLVAPVQVLIRLAEMVNEFDPLHLVALDLLQRRTRGVQSVGKRGHLAAELTWLHYHNVSKIGRAPENASIGF